MYEKLVEQLGNYSKRYRSGETLGRAIEYTEDLLDEASAAIETLETLFENYESVVNTKNRLAVKVHELQSELKRVKRERDAAIADIPHKCWSCTNGFYTEIGFDCDQAHYKSGVKNCLSWEWRGVKEDKHDV